MKFRFFRRDPGPTLRRRSASCPNLEQATGSVCGDEEEVTDVDTNVHNTDNSSSGSDTEVTEKVGKMERLQARRSIRRVRQKEKEKVEKSEKNMLSMDDYFGKLSELKLWLKEEKHKDPDAMRSPKLKAHFKTFVRLWNKRKLPANYYRTLSVNLEAADQTLDLDTDLMEESVAPRFPLGDKTSHSSSCVTPLVPASHLDISSDYLCKDLSADNKLDPSSRGHDSPFSTFGKAVNDVEGLTSPAVLADQMQKGIGSKERKVLRFGKQHSQTDIHSPSSSGSQSSPRKFATISRSTPTPKPPTAGGVVKLCPVASPQCPPSVGKMTLRPLPDTPLRPRPRSSQNTPEESNSSTNRELLVSGWNLASEQSPVYASVMDAIPYSSGSPKYAEIDENGMPRFFSTYDASHDRHLTQVKDQRSASLKITDKSYKLGKTNMAKKSNLNRRRSKSMEYIYAVPHRSEHYFGRQKYPIFEEESPSEEISQPPPIPERKYSPQKMFDSSSYQPPPIPERSYSPEKNVSHNIRAPPIPDRTFISPYKEYNDGFKPPPVPERTYSPKEAGSNTQSSLVSVVNDSVKVKNGGKSLESLTNVYTPSKVVAVANIFTSLSDTQKAKKSKDKSKKRRSKENIEQTTSKTSPPKKSKAQEADSGVGVHDDTASTISMASSNWTTSESSSGDMGGHVVKTPSKLSILTGSLRPTTRSARKAADGASPSDNISNVGTLQLTMFDESPKFPRRKLKRRSSSFSVTPGKGLTFGKSSKVSTSSPRRVSFAKDVKDTESRSTPRCRSSSRKTNMMTLGGRYLTRQTRDSAEFESFIAAHNSPSPKKGNSPGKMTSSPGKSASPIKTSLTNLLSAVMKKDANADYSSNTELTKRTVPSRNAAVSSTGGAAYKNEGNSHFTEKSVVTNEPPLKSSLKKVSVVSNTSSISLRSIDESSVSSRQLGRRVIGAPAKGGHHGQNINDGKKLDKAGNQNVGQNVNDVARSKPDKIAGSKSKLANSVSSISITKQPLRFVMSKLSHKTSVLCAGGYSDQASNHGSRQCERKKSKEDTHLATQPYAVSDVTTTAYTSSNDTSIKNFVVEDDNRTSLKQACDPSEDSSLCCRNNNATGYVQPCGGSCSSQDETGSSNPSRPTSQYEQPLSPVMRKSSFTDDPLLRFDDVFEETETSNKPHTKPGVVIDKLAGRAADVKAFARVAKIWNRTVGFDVSVEPFATSSGHTQLSNRGSQQVFEGKVEHQHHQVNLRHNKNIKTQILALSGDTISDNVIVMKNKDNISGSVPDEDQCSETTSISHSSLTTYIESGNSTDSGFDSVKQMNHDISDAVSKVSANMVQNSVKEILYDSPKPISSNSEAIISSPTKASQQETDSYSSSSVEEIHASRILNQSTSKESPSGRPSFILPPYPELSDGMERESLDSSFMLPPYPALRESVGRASLDTSFILPPYPAPIESVGGQSLNASFVLPPYPDAEVDSTDHPVSLSENMVHPCDKQDKDNCKVTLKPIAEKCLDENLAQENLTSSASGGYIELTHIKNSLTETNDLETNIQGEESLKGTNPKVSGVLDRIAPVRSVQRINSLKQASPRIVDSDSWVTARRRSSRTSRGQRSFRTTHNQHEMRIATQDSESFSMTGGDEEIKQSSIDACDVSNTSSQLSVTERNAEVQPKGNITASDVMSDTSLSSMDPSNYDTLRNEKYFTMSPTNTECSQSVSTPTGINKPKGIKPATLPKSTKALTFAQKRLNVQNFVKTETKTRPAPKRRSSLSKSQAIPGNLKTTKASTNTTASKSIYSVKTEVGKTAIKQTTDSQIEGEINKDVSSPLSVRKVVRKKSSIGINDKGRRRSSSEHAGRSEKTLSSRGFGQQSKLSLFNQTDKALRKKSSIGNKNLENRRRRSKSQGGVEESQVSFSERRKFFQQLQSNSAGSAPLKSATPSGRPRMALRNLGDRNEEASTTVADRAKFSDGVKNRVSRPTKSVSLTRKFPAEKTFTLSPSVGTDV